MEYKLKLENIPGRSVGRKFSILYKCLHLLQFQVAILLDSPDLSSRQRCGGSLISDKHVLTSALCVSFDFTYYVHLGDTILGNDKDVTFNRTVLVTKKTLHPDYDFSENNNIAILEMAEPMPLDQHANIKPVCLPDQGADFSRFRADFTETTGIVSGWGNNERAGDYNSWLHEIQVTVFADEECDQITPSQLCAGVLEGSEAPCAGDDGGPLVVSDPNVNNNGLTIAGIVGFGCNSVQTYTKVSLFRNWINGIIGDAKTCPPPP